MSKIGKKPIQVPNGVEVHIDGSVVTIKGPKWQLTHTFPQWVHITLHDGILTTAVDHEDLWNLRGLSRTLLANMIHGVTQGYEKKLLLIGVWYAVKLEWKKFVFSLWLSHKVPFDIPEGITASVEQDAKGNYVITLQSIDKQFLGEYAAKVKALKKPEPYKGKGIRYIDEYVKLKPWKAAKK